MPTRNFFFAGFFVVCFLVMDSYKFLLLCGLDAEKSWEGYRGGFYRGLRILVCFVVINRGVVVVDRGELHGGVSPFP
jgi:hypothetical protein